LTSTAGTPLKTPWYASLAEGFESRSQLPQEVQFYPGVEGTDPLTGNRYLFAAANPVGFYDDGHGPTNAGHEGSDQVGFAVPADRLTACDFHPERCDTGASDAVTNVVNGFQDVATRAGHVARATINAPKTLLAYTYARLRQSGNCDLEEGLTVICYDVRMPLPSSAFTVGSAVLTSESEESFKDRSRGRDLQTHETAHTTQWATDPMFPLDYVTGLVQSYLTTGTRACGHPQEIEAGLKAGGYDC
jgi:hypothetical protein